MSFTSQIVDLNDNAYTLLIGKTAQGNTKIIKSSQPDDIWFHFDKISGPHMILQTNGTAISKRDLYFVARKLFDVKKNAPKNAKIIYTYVKNVKLTEIPGEVCTKQTNYIRF